MSNLNDIDACWHIHNYSSVWFYSALFFDFSGLRRCFSDVCTHRGLSAALAGAWAALKVYHSFKVFFAGMMSDVLVLLPLCTSSPLLGRLPLLRVFPNTSLEPSSLSFFPSHERPRSRCWLFF
jgi:hypothetical protein